MRKYGANFPRGHFLHLFRSTDKLTPSVDLSTTTLFRVLATEQGAQRSLHAHFLKSLEYRHSSRGVAGSVHVAAGAPRLSNYATAAGTHQSRHVATKSALLMGRTAAEGAQPMGLRRAPLGRKCCGGLTQFSTSTGGASSAKVKSQQAAREAALKGDLRQFYLKVHPDLFSQQPQAQEANEHSFKLLQQYLIAAKDGGPRGKGDPLSFPLEFYLHHDRDVLAAGKGRYCACCDLSA